MNLISVACRANDKISSRFDVKRAKEIIKNE